MSYNSYQEKLNQLRFLIKHNMAGSTSDLAEKLSVSKRTVYRMLEQLRSEGLSFRYSHHRKSYVMEGETLLNK